MVINSQGLCYHCAWADDASGTGFSLTEYDAAEYVGRYKDHSETESTDPDSYIWTALDEDTTEDDEDESDDDIGDLINTIDDLSSSAVDAAVSSADNTTAIQGGTSSSDEGLGNVNILSGTNSGTDNYTLSGTGFTLAAESGTIYDDTADPVSYLTVTCSTAGSGLLFYTSTHLRDVLGAEQDDNAFTISADVNESALFTIPVTVANTDGANAQISFDSVDLSPASDETDLSGSWSHYAATAQATGTATDAQVIRFDLSAMPAGATLKIANLKIEYGATDTEWRQSQEEIAATANSALATATKTNNYFWHDADGAHVATESGQGSTGKNVLLTSDGMKIRKDASTLADFSGTGTTIYDNDREIYAMNSSAYSGTIAGGTVTGYQSTLKNTNASGGVKMIGGTNASGATFSEVDVTAGSENSGTFPDQSVTLLHAVTTGLEAIVYATAKKGEASGISFQYDKVSGATVLFPLDDLIYTPGDSAYGTSILSSGFITASKKEFRCVVPIPRPLIGISAATVTVCQVIVRQGGSYVLGGPGSAVDCLTDGTVTPIITPFGITLRIVRTTKMTDATNNGTATGVLELGLTFTES